MKIFQVLHSYPNYIDSFENRYNISDDIPFEQHRAFLIQDRFYASHILEPCLKNDGGFYTMWNYASLQRKWANEKGWLETDLKKILFAQIEEYQPDVFYNMSPILFNPDEIMNNINKKIIKVAWFASPEKNNIDFTVYNTRLTNYEPDVKQINNSFSGQRHLLNPSYDPVMEKYSVNEERTIDILFYGQYIDDYFKKRNTLIDHLIQWKTKEDNLNISIHLAYTKKYRKIYPLKKPEYLKRIFNTTMRKFPSNEVVKFSEEPLYGVELYKKISQAKIVFNASVDFTGSYKVNMRNFESLGCGAHLLSDNGIYPNGFIPGENFTVYKDFNDFKKKSKYFLQNISESRQIAKNGVNMVTDIYSKSFQFEKFKEIINSIS